MRTRVFDAHHRYLSEEIWSCGQDLFETPVASIQSGEHLHFEDRDEVGWLGPSRSLRMMKKSEREERSGTEPPVLHTHDPPILPSLPLSLSPIPIQPAFLIAFLASSLPLHRIRRGGLRSLGTRILLEKDGGGEHFPQIQDDRTKI